LIACLFNSDLCLNFIKSITFLDAKRPITKKLLQSIDFDALINNIPQKKLIKQATWEYQHFKVNSDKKIEWLSAFELLSKDITTATSLQKYQPQNNSKQLTFNF
ncbi:MAG: SAM-dependent methyltransferase, partial [Cyanobacteria bacterium J06573_2]